MTIFIDVLSAVFLACGAFFSLVGGIGLILQAGLTLVAVKLAMIGLLILFASPTATHALAKAALLSGLAPKLGAQRSGEEVISSKP